VKNYEFTGRYNDIEIRWGEKAKIDDKDKEILFLLSKNSRMSLSKIANEVGLSRDAIKYRMERMTRDDIIQGFEVVINPPKIGFPLFNYVALALWNLSPERENEFIAYVKEAPYIIWASKTMGRYDAFLFILSKDPSHLNRITTGLREKFGDIIKDIEIHSVVREFKYTQFPGKFD